MEKAVKQDTPFLEGGIGVPFLPMIPYLVSMSPSLSLLHFNLVHELVVMKSLICTFHSRN